MISCKHAAELILKQEDEDLTPEEQEYLREHLEACRIGHEFRKQLQVINCALCTLIKEQVEEVTDTDFKLKKLSPDAKDRIKGWLKEQK